MALFRLPAASNWNRATQHPRGVGWHILAYLSDHEARAGSPLKKRSQNVPSRIKRTSHYFLFARDSGTIRNSCESHARFASSMRLARTYREMQF